MSKCGEKTEVYSRVTGYFRPVSAWNKGKKEEYKDRKVYKAALPLIALAALLLAGCGHNAISYGDGVMLETTINPESYAFGVSLRYGKILTVAVRENAEVEMEGAGNGSATPGGEGAQTGASSTGKVRVKIGPQITGRFVEAVKAGAAVPALSTYSGK